MNFEIRKVITGTGKKKEELRIWNFGPRREERKRRFNDKASLFAALEKMRKEEEKLKSPVKSDPIFGVLYQEFKSQSFSPGWKKNLDGYWNEFGKEIKDVQASNIGPELLKKLETKFTTKGNSRKTTNLKIGFIKAVLNFAYNMELIPENRAARFKVKKVLPPKIEFWERDDAEDFLTFASEKYPKGSAKRWIYVVYLLGISAGLRAGEIWALKPRCLKPSLGVMGIDEQFDRVSKTFRRPKGRGSRNVPMNEVILEELEAQNKGRNETFFSTLEGNPVCHDNFTDRVFANEFGVKIGQWAGPKIKFHGLRHTAATLMLGSGIDVRTVQEVLGHKSMSTTMGYTHLIGGNVKLAGEKFIIRPKVKRLQIVN